MRLDARMQVTLVHADASKFGCLASVCDTNAFVCRWHVRDDGLFFQVGKVEVCFHQCVYLWHVDIYSIAS